MTGEPNVPGGEPHAVGGEPGTSRRQILVTGGIATAAALLLAGPAVAAELAKRSSAPTLVRRPDAAGAPPPEQLHVQFGADAATQIAVSWAAQDRVAKPRLRLGQAGGGFGVEVPAEERTYTEVMTGQKVYTYHARLTNLAPDTAHVYEVIHEGAAPVAGTFRTGPIGRSKGFRFTSFGDQGIPTRVGTHPGSASVNAGYVVDAVDALDPLFHLMNGDLSYANSSDMPVQTWAAYFTNNMRSARHRPWMPAVGNHENEVGNASHGLVSYQTRFELPDNGSAEFRGNWYAFTVGSVRVLSISNDDVCVEDGGFSGVRCKYVPGYRTMGLNPYIRGYSRGQQRAWLERELAAARQSAAIDWIVICMHQVVMSSAHFNGADIGIRREFVPLFDRYGVDPSRPYVLFVGRVTRQKGIVHLVRAIPQIDPDAQIVLCAGAPDTPEIGAEMEAAVAAVQATHRGVIWVREMVDRASVVQLYAHAAVFCCPSIYEPFGIINLEAMACGVPVAAFPVQGPCDVIGGAAGGAPRAGLGLGCMRGA